MKIAIDLDEVIYPFVNAFVKTYQTVSQKNIQDEFNNTLANGNLDYNLETWPCFDPKLAGATFKTMSNGAAYVSEAPDEEASKFLRYLDAIGHDAIIITARAISIPNLANATEKWLENNNLPFVDLVVVPFSFEKHLYCTAWGIDVLIDDRFETIASAYGKGLKTSILLDKPWNRRNSNFSHLVANSFFNTEASLSSMSVYDILNKEYPGDFPDFKQFYLGA